MKKKYNNNVFFLGMVSLFTDLSSQMIYPLIPEFLMSIGAKKIIVGIVEGIAESTASLFKTLFGKLSDKYKNRKAFILLGYGISAFSKPFLYFATIWHHVLGVKFIERLGKASRTPARDALISTSVDPKNKGKAFGFHRAMDRIGAIGGPLLAILILFLFKNNVRMVFLFSFFPAVLALFFIIFTKETAVETTHTEPEQKKRDLRNPGFVVFLISNIVFTFGNSSNAFLILKARETGLSIALIPVIWIVYNIFCTISSPVFGTLSDKVGRKPIIIISFLYYACVYFLFGFTNSLLVVWFLFGAYGIYYGLSQGVFKAYISDMVSPENRATAYGLFNTGIGLTLFPASLLTGVIWDHFGSMWAFTISAGFSLLGFLIFLVSLAFKKKG